MMCEREVKGYELGCYGDGAFGADHCTCKVFEIAEGEGWSPKLDESEQKVYDHFFAAINSNPISDTAYFNEEEEYIIDALENEALDYLNNHCADDSHYWGYENGDFGYWEIEEE